MTMYVHMYGVVRVDDVVFFFGNDDLQMSTRLHQNNNNNTTNKLSEPQTELETKIQLQTKKNQSLDLQLAELKKQIQGTVLYMYSMIRVIDVLFNIIWV